MNGKKVIVLFDFDGTITSKDSFLEFLKYYAGFWKYYGNLLTLIPSILFHYMGLISNSKLKEKFLTTYLKGESLEVLEKKGSDFYKDVVEGILRPKALEKIIWHNRQKHILVLVSASADLWIKRFAEKYQMKLISTSLEFKEGIFTGKIEGKNCNGQEKLERLKKEFDFSEFEEIYGYGDSKGDEEMLSLASSSFFKPFRD